MEKIVDITAYLPAQNHIRPGIGSQSVGKTILMALEAVVTAIIGISMMIGVAAFLLML